MKNWHPLIIVSADAARSSDVYHLTKDWQYQYTNVELPKWDKRLDYWAHKEVREQHLRQGIVSVCGVTCEYVVLHSIPTVKNKKSVVEGPHCALIDAAEIHYHLLFDNKFAMVRNAAYLDAVSHTLR